jgi:non-specific serine/threonine protein kinase
VDDKWSVGVGLLQRGTVALLAGEYAAARGALTESLARARAMGNRWTTGASLEWLGNTALAAGDADEADALYGAALAAFREAGDGPGAANALLGRGLAAFERGDRAAARRLVRESMLLQRRTGAGRWIPWMLDGFAALARRDGRLDRAARLLGLAAALRSSFRDVFGADPFVRTARDQDTAAARAALGEAAFAAAWAEGEAMSLDEATGYTLDDESASDATPAVPSATAPDRPAGPGGLLSPREREVAALIARGYTNRRIAAALVVAETTAERHVANILAKLGAHARSEVAAWAATHLPSAHDG